MIQPINGYNGVIRLPREAEALCDAQRAVNMLDFPPLLARERLFFEPRKLPQGAIIIYGGESFAKC